MQEHLKSILKQEDTILFIGSGISTWSGLPTWPTLIDELAEYLTNRGIDASLIKSEAKRGELLQAASYAFDKLTNMDIAEFVRQACRLTSAHPHEIHHKIVTLGPNCFITTNYDHLIESSLRQWRTDRYWRIVKNCQLIETAEIVQARANDFVFKLHGDAEDAESIILTREQYRKLLPDGEYHHALETARTLMVSRPVVYLGFGLRDPDFLYVRDLLANTYKGGTRDHYAIIADITAYEMNYWKRNYGIHMITYSTTNRSDGSRDHSALLSLLDELRVTLTPGAPAKETLDQKDIDVRLILSLARHAARFAMAEKPQIEFPIKVHSANKPTHGLFINTDPFDNSRVEELLDENNGRFVLIGLPGAGKSYALRHSAARLSEKLHQICLSDSFNSENVIVPIVADLKLYSGDLFKLIEKVLPIDLSLTTLLKHFKVKIYLDAFNEMHREYTESGAWENDFNEFIETVTPASVIITSRTSDELDKLKLPVYKLDQLDSNFVEAELEKNHISIAGKFHRDIHSLLLKPFYFQLINNGTVKLSEEPHPRDVYHAIFTRLSFEYEQRFSVSLDLERILSTAAYNAVDRGEEAIPVTIFAVSINNILESEGYTLVVTAELINWLIAKNILLPYSASRVAFFHQSVTEFLAADEFVRRYTSTPNMLKEKLSWRNWDQVLLLTLSMLPEQNAEEFLNDVVSMDIELALAAVKYMETSTEEVVERLLEQMTRLYVKRGLDHNGIVAYRLMRDLPVSPKHEPKLRQMISMGNIIGGAAASCLFKLKGMDVRDELIELLFNYRNDYNFCSEIAAEIKPTITNDDLSRLVDLTGRVQSSLDGNNELDTEVGGFISSIGYLLKGIKPSVIYEAFFNLSKPINEQSVNISIILDGLREQEAYSSDSLAIASELLLAGANESAVAISFIARFSEKPLELDWSPFNEPHIKRIISILRDDDRYGQWSLDSLKAICNYNKDIVKIPYQLLKSEHGVLKAALLYAINSNDSQAVFDALSEVQKMHPEELEKEPLGIIRHIELNWAGQETLFVELLRLRNFLLAYCLIESISDPVAGYIIDFLEIGPIQWWLEWLAEDNQEGLWWYFQDRMTSLFANKLRKEVQDEFVSEFNNENSQYRKMLSRTVLIKQHDLTTDRFNNGAISFLLSDLTSEDCCDHHYAHLLGRTATESFVLERLMPLLSDKSEPFNNNLIRVLREAGKRHGRRYVAC